MKERNKHSDLTTWRQIQINGIVANGLITAWVQDQEDQDCSLQLYQYLLAIFDFYFPWEL